MNTKFSRREIIGLLGAGALMGMMPRVAGAGQKLFRIRTITAGVQMQNTSDTTSLMNAIEFLLQARSSYQALGYEVQTVRVATQPLTEYCEDWSSDRSIEKLLKLDQIATAHQLNFSIGPVITKNLLKKDFAAWAAELIKNTQSINFSVQVASTKLGVHQQTVDVAAEAIQSIAQVLTNGEGNFRFAASAFCPPGTPFFPAAYHQGKPAFSLGLESPRLLQTVFSETSDRSDAKRRLKQQMENLYEPLAKQALILAGQSQRRYLGMDVSPAPAPDASIGQAIEILTGAPFGSASTLAGCAAITDVLKSLNLKKCGYSGLMLPVLEDSVLSARAAEGRYSVSELLLYSSVCGTGLDVVPLAGDTTSDAIAALIGDMAALATKYQKPLSARLLPLPGLKVGDIARFNNPYLVDSVVMKID
ncbi:MAG: DUF711 family protein [Pseudomonadales bacterium]|nr:DUF711 family protein [Pseudomonadales bacterium]